MLERSDAWGRFPTPVDDVLAAAKLRVAPTSMFDPGRLVAYLRDKANETARSLKSAISKVLGIYDAGEQVIHIDDSVGVTRQTFLKLHETGHHEMPTHRKLFSLFQDCEKTLAPEIADQFEREANNFARFALFQGDAYMKQAADMPCELKTTRSLAKVFGASLYASAREFVRTHHRACAVFVLDPLAAGQVGPITVRRIEASSSYAMLYGRPSISTIGPDHPLWPVLPWGRRVTRPMGIGMRDPAGALHECIAEAFDTTFNILILVVPVKALTTTSIILPSDVSA
ncbi:uncharacterized protein DUF955 [Trinickia symbiotica]|nr:uncharacterized protein DUF955 [Trinickia symbiotica]